jgi:hypothetical protein
VDRAGGHHGSGGWNDRLGELVGVKEPTVIVKGVDEAVNAIKKWTEENRMGGGDAAKVAHESASAAMGPG